MPHNNDIKKILELENLGKQDMFQFKCDGCGECCKHRDDILLTPYDIFRICRFLKVAFDDFMETYCELYIGSTSKLPIVRLRTSALCVFLMHGKCLIHEVKPTVCALYPLGRIAGFQQESCEIRYFLQDVQCGTKDQENIVEDWLKHLGDDNEECMRIWHSMLGELTILSQNTQEADEKVIEKLASVVFEILYNGYDYSEEFLSQFKERLRVVKKFCRGYKDMTASRQQ